MGSVPIFLSRLCASAVLAQYFMAKAHNIFILSIPPMLKYFTTPAPPKGEASLGLKHGWIFQKTKVLQILLVVRKAAL